MTEERLIELVRIAAEEEGYILGEITPTEPIPLSSLSWMDFLLLVEQETGRELDPRKLSRRAWSVREFKEWLDG